MEGWKEERCPEWPEEFERVAPNTYIQRRNIREDVHESKDGMPEYVDYVCESRYISSDDYIDILKEKEAKNREDIEFIAIMSDIELEG